jgi:hypothetical protein
MSATPVTIDFTKLMENSKKRQKKDHSLFAERRRDSTLFNTSDYESAYVLIVSQGHMAILTIENRRGTEIFGLLGGKVDPKDQGSLYSTAAREAQEATDKLLSDTTYDNIVNGCVVQTPDALIDNHGSNSVVMVHITQEDDDLDIEKRWVPGKTLKTKGSSTTQTGVKWVPLPDLCDESWREQNMHFHASRLVGRVSDCLSGLRVSGEPKEDTKNIGDNTSTPEEVRKAGVKPVEQGIHPPFPFTVTGTGWTSMELNDK